MMLKYITNQLWKLIQEILDYFGFHSWKYKYEEAKIIEVSDGYGCKHLKGFPSISYYKNILTGEIIELPDGFTGFHKEYQVGDPIYRKVRICKVCHIKQEYIRNYLGKRIWI